MNDTRTRAKTVPTNDALRILMRAANRRGAADVQRYLRHELTSAMEPKRRERDALLVKIEAARAAKNFQFALDSADELAFLNGWVREAERMIAFAGKRQTKLDLERVKLEAE